MADMKYVQMTLDDWMALKGRLEMELKASAAGFVRIGYILRKIKDSEGYRNEGYDSLTEWAKDNYSLSASTVSRFMAINKKYSIDGYGEQLKLEYAEFGSAKLAEMLALPDADLEMVSPEMKKEDIREIKKFNKEVAKEEPPAIEEVDVKTEPAIAEEQTPEQAAPEVPNMLPEHKWIFEFFRENKEIMNDLYSSKAYEEGNTDGMKEIVNPAGARTFRYKTTMVSMMEARIMVKVFPKSPAPMSWGGFFQIAADMFEGRIDGKRTYTAVFGEDPVKEKPKLDPVKEIKKAIKAAEPEKKKTEAFAPAQKSEPDIVENNVETAPTIAENTAPEEAEQVEIDEIMPAPTEPDPMRDLKDRFTAELNSLKVLLDCDNFGGMKQTIDRLEQLRGKMEALKSTQQ